MWLWAFGQAVVLPFYRMAFRLRVEGTENVPADGGVILCSNHISAHDPPILGMVSPRRVRFMAKDELFHIPVLGWFLSQGGGAFPVKRGTPDRAALKRALAVLGSGGCFGIFPEGTRSHTGEVGKPEPGAAYLALKSGAVLIPVSFSGSYKFREVVTVRFGPPVDLSPYQSGKLTGNVLEAAGEAIMAAIRTQR